MGSFTSLREEKKTNKPNKDTPKNGGEGPLRIGGARVASVLRQFGCFSDSGDGSPPQSRNVRPSSWEVKGSAHTLVSGYSSSELK